MLSRNSWRKLPQNGVLFVLLATFWGTSFVAIEVGLHYFPPLLFAGLRYAVAGAVVLAYAVATADRWLPRTRAELLEVAITGALIIGAYHGLLYLGELRVSGAVAAILVSLSPIMTAVFGGALLPSERIEPTSAVGFGLGFLGVLVVANPSAAGVVGIDPLGLTLILLGGATFALGAVLTQPLPSELPLPALGGWAMLVGAALLLVVAAGRGESAAAIQWTTTAVGSLVYLTVVSGVVAFLLYFALLDRIGPVELHLVGYVEPVVAALVSWILLGTVVDAATAAGFAVVVAGFVLVKFQTVRDHVPVPSLRQSVRAARERL